MRLYDVSGGEEVYRALQAVRGELEGHDVWRAMKDVLGSKRV